jgi:hypothetical protein
VSSRRSCLLPCGLVAALGLMVLLVFGALLMGVYLWAQADPAALGLATTTPTATATWTATPVPTATSTHKTGSIGSAGTGSAGTSVPGARPEVTPGGPTPTPTLIPAVDWPQLPDLKDRQPQQSTQHFAVYAADPTDALLNDLVQKWTPQMDTILADDTARLHRELPRVPVNVVFQRAYDARCPARGLTSPGGDKPLLMVYVNDATTDIQIQAVLAHEMAHHLTSGPGFVGDAVLTEGIANWGGGDRVLLWQNFPSWDAAVLNYLARGEYESVADPAALNPQPGENCLARRDRVYNVRAAFVGWLIDRIGLERVLAMPYLEVPVIDPQTGQPQRNPDTHEVEMARQPDYVAATGYDLPTLEALWLMELLAKR